MSLNIEGCLRNHQYNKRLTYIVENGKTLTDRKAKIRLTSLLAQGIRVIDCSGECYRFDYQKGCPGHINSLKPNDEALVKINAEYKAYKQKINRNWKEAFSNYISLKKYQPDYRLVWIKIISRYSVWEMSKTKMLRLRKDIYEIVIE